MRGGRTLTQLQHSFQLLSFCFQRFTPQAGGKLSRWRENHMNAQLLLHCQFCPLSFSRPLWASLTGHQLAVQDGQSRYRWKKCAKAKTEEKTHDRPDQPVCQLTDKGKHISTSESRTWRSCEQNRNLNNNIKSLSLFEPGQNRAV